MPVAGQTPSPWAQSLGINADDVQRLANELVNGVMGDGFDGYFFNSDDDPALALQALELIGAVQTAAVVRREFGRFPNGKPPADRFERQTVLETLNPEDEDGDVFDQEDRDLFAYPEDVEALAATYWLQHHHN